MRECDEAHVQRLLVKALAEHGGNYAAAERALGVPRNALYYILKMHKPVTPKAAQAVGYRRKIGGRLSPAHRPTKFIQLEED